ncbi:MAG: hypothetical protein H0T79_03855 [Deltaproteobacteria bacterium]|nr:hypothetical protein [Deltaproteobacteria bacterium]
MTRSVLAALLLVAATAAPVSADAKADAQVRIDHATQLHQAGAFAEALDELMVAYTLDPRPELLYALGQLHVKLGHCSDAVTYYQRFLGTSPAAGPADAARQAIETCKKAPPPEPPPAGDPPVDPTADPAADPTTDPTPQRMTAAGPPAWYEDVVLDGLVGGGIVAGLVGVVLYGAARGALDDADASSTYNTHLDHVDRAHAERTLAVIFGVGGIALIGVGVARYMMRDTTPDQGVGIEPTTGGGVVTWSGQFR